MLKSVSIVAVLLMVGVSGMEIPFLLNMQDLLATSNNIKSIADDNLPVESLLSNNSQLNEVLDVIDGLTLRLIGFEYRLSFQLKILTNELKLDKKLIREIQNVYLFIQKLDFIYDMFWRNIEKITNFDQRTLQKLMNSVSFDGKTSVQKELSELYNRVIPPKGQTIWEILQTHRKNLDTLRTCNMKESYQYLIYKLHGIVILSELKGLVINMYLFKTYFSSMNVTITDLVERTQGEFVRRTNQYLQAIQQVIPKLSREIYLCDSSDYKLGINYLELEGLFTGYVISQYEVDTLESVCNNNCDNLQSLLHRRCYKNGGQEFCTSHKCSGLVHHCKKIGERVDVCEENPSSFKRYRYVRSHDIDSNKLYGKWSECEEGQFATLDTFWFRNHQCDVCMCQCSQNWASSRAIRSFSLRPQISNVNKNKVVSNFRFVLKDNLIHIQIEESLLQKHGYIESYSSSWVPLENFKEIYNSSRGGFIMINNTQSTLLTQDTDFARVRVQSPLMNLDEISAGPNYVLTGVWLNREKASTVKFQVNSSPLQLEIHVTPFDFASGQLNPTDDNPSIWLTSKTQPNPPPEYSQTRQQSKFGGYVYKYEQKKNIPDVKPNQFVKFQMSSIDSDAGQSTIPFLDARPVLHENIYPNTMALSGAGIIHRKNDKFAGLLALKALSIDLSHYIDTNVDENQMNYYEQLTPLPSMYDEFNIE